VTKACVHGLGLLLVSFMFAVLTLKVP